MASKYIIHGATYNGDGTTSSAAASNGAAGAWNTITYFEGTTPAYGTLAAGDTVYIRSLDAADAAISVTKTTAQSLGNASASELLPITWVFDAGTVWSGISGVITYTMTSTAAWTLRAYNNLIGVSYNLIIKNTNTTLGWNIWCTLNDSCTENIKFDCSATATSTGPQLVISGGSHTNLWLKHGSLTDYAISTASSYGVVLINPKIEITGPLFRAANACAIISVVAAHYGGTTVYGGSLVGAAGNSFLSGVSLVYGVYPAGNFNSYGFVFPATMILANTTTLTALNSVVCNGSDGALGNVVRDRACEYSSRFDGFYPTLNASLETSGATPWAYKLYPYRTSPQNPAKIVTSKLWTQAAAAKKVTLEILWPTEATSSFDPPTVDKVWITATYIDDSTGLQVTQSTRAFTGATLATSTEGWSGTTYGATNFDKRKLEITTSGSIRQDTMVMVSLFVIPRAVSADPLDIIMVCPDVTLTTP